jgi:hypothetical protein
VIGQLRTNKSSILGERNLLHSRKKSTKEQKVHSKQQVKEEDGREPLSYHILDNIPFSVTHNLVIAKGV